MSSCAALWMPIPDRSTSLGTVRRTEAADEPVQSQGPLVELEPAASEASQRCVHAVAGRKLAAADGELEQALDSPLVAQVLVGADEHALVWLLGVVVALTAVLCAIVNARNASTAPSRFLGTAFACPASTARAAASPSTGSLLPLRRRFCPVEGHRRRAGVPQPRRDNRPRSATQLLARSTKSDCASCSPRMTPVAVLEFLRAPGPMRPTGGGVRVAGRRPSACRARPAGRSGPARCPSPRAV